MSTVLRPLHPRLYKLNPISGFLYTTDNCQLYNDLGCTEMLSWIEVVNINQQLQSSAHEKCPQANNDI